MQGFGSVGGCLGPGLEEGRRVKQCYVSVSDTSLGVILLNECGRRLGTHLLASGTGRSGLGAPGAGAGPQTGEGLCTAEGLRTRREILGSAGRGF